MESLGVNNTRSLEMNKRVKAWIGIDPGKKGAAVLLAVENGEYVIDVFEWPKSDRPVEAYDKLSDWDLQYNIAGCFLEKVSAMPGQGVTSMFSFGMNYGAWITLLQIITIPYELKTPQSWQKGIIVKEDGKDKLRVRNALYRVFSPAIVNEYTKGSKGGYKDGVADALLMAYACMKGSVK
jgi:hypothetical protein